MGGYATMKRALLRAELNDALDHYEATRGALPGIVDNGMRVALVEQLVMSVRRTLYFERLLSHPSGWDVADPASDAFDPLKAAVLQAQEGNRDEAFWLVFLFVHFGKHRRSNWRLIADVYGQLGNGTCWTWDAVVREAEAFRHWLDENAALIKSRGSFGNHRKYESLGAWTTNGTGAVVASYVDWVGAAGHDSRISQVTEVAETPPERFGALYKSVRTVRRFGRTGAFDYCSTLAKFRFVPIEPNAACLAGASGPLTGARLLLGEPGNRLPSTVLEAMLAPLPAALGIGFDDLEDALCNWQKSPSEFKPFLG